MTNRAKLQRVIVMWVAAGALVLLGAGPAAADTEPPVVTLTVPVTGGSVTLPGSYVPTGTVDLSGTVTDATGVDFVRLQVQRRSDEHFWNGVGWVSTPAWVTATVTEDTWLLPQVEFVVEGSYAVRFATRDTAGVTGGVRDNPRYRLEAVNDITAPTGKFLSEALHGIVRPDEPTVFETDASFAAGTYHVEVRAEDEIGVAYAAIQIVREGPRPYWNGTSWQWGPKWVTVPLGDRLTFTPYKTTTPVDFTQPGTYTVRMFLRDFAGNASTAAANPQMTVVIAADETAPVARMTTPFWEYAILPGGAVRPGHPTRNTMSPGIQRIAGQAADVGLGVESVRAQIERRTAPNMYWNGSAWQSDPIWFATRLFVGDNPNLVGWRVLNVDMTEPGSYAVRLSAIDFAGNRSFAADNWRSFIRIE